MENGMMATFVASALKLLKDRLDRMADDTSRDSYFESRIKQSIAELERTGIVLTDSIDDLMLVVDMAAWNHANRDKPGSMPDWLAKKRRERWLSQR